MRIGETLNELPGTLEPDHIEILHFVNYRKGQWFGWSDTKNKIYENLIVHDGKLNLLNKKCIDGLQAMKDDYTATQYKRDRCNKISRFERLCRCNVLE